MPNNSRAASPTILVTGASGQVGYEVVRLMAPIGRVVAPRRPELEMASPDSITEVLKRVRPDIVVNAAAYTAVDRAEMEPEICASVNATAPGILSEELSRSGGALVHFSTDYVFDGGASRDYTEDDEPCPMSVYGRTKLAGERAVVSGGAPHLIFRTSWVYGDRGHNFMRTILRLARERDELRVVDDQVGAPTWSRALAAAVTTVAARLLSAPGGALEAAQELGGLYHLTAAGRTSWHGFARAILELDPARSEHRCRVMHAVPTSEYPTPARRPANSVLASDRARERLGLAIPDWREQLALVLSG
jgi:dTDP-4-dehydrorhamnose reductase